MGMGGIAGGGAHRMVCSGGGVARPICSAPYGPSAEAKSARLTSWRATAARTVRVCAHLPRAFMHPGLGACVPCGASCSGGPALAYPISGGGASCHRPVPAASRFWARRDARSKGGVLSSAGVCPDGQVAYFSHFSTACISRNLRRSGSVSRPRSRDWVPILARGPLGASRGASGGPGDCCKTACFGPVRSGFV